MRNRSRTKRRHDTYRLLFYHLRQLEAPGGLFEVMSEWLLRPNPVHTALLTQEDAERAYRAVTSGVDRPSVVVCSYCGSPITAEGWTCDHGWAYEDLIRRTDP